MTAPVRRHRRLAAVVGAALSGVLLAGPAGAAPAAAGADQAPPELRVAVGGPYPTVQAALAAAPPGAVVRVAPGVYRERVVIERPVHLVGAPGAVLDGGGEGTILTIRADGTRVEGLVLRGSGSKLDREDSGVLVTARNVELLHNRLEDVLFGFNLKEAHGAVLTGNIVRGKPLSPSFRGDGIRLWHSHGVRVEQNDLEGLRDVLIWYSRATRFVSNRVAGGRYGLHYMYAEDSVFLDNQFVNNAVGSYVMFTRRIVLRGNVFEGSREATGYGLAFKDADDIEVADNLFVNNHTAIYLDNTPSVDTSRVRFAGNVVVNNGLGMVWLSNVGAAVFTRNTFFDNHQAVRVEGGRQDRIRWAEARTGNYWDDYAGFDLDGDGLGDVPHRILRFVDLLTAAVPEARLLLHSPALAALDLATRALPAYQPRTLVEDPAPLMQPLVPDAFRGGRAADPALAAAAAAVALAAVTLLWIPAARWRRAGGVLR